MIVYLKNDEINRELWDMCISASPSSKPYAHSWYLDIMAPGWEALVDDDYDSVFPVPVRSRFGIKYIATPIFLQQLGAFSPDKSTEAASDEFLDYMPEFYRLIDLSIGQKISHGGFRVTERSDFELALDRSFERLYENFTSDCRRNINIAARNNPELVTGIKPSELIALFRTGTGAGLKSIKDRDYKRLENLMDYCIANRMGFITGSRDSSGQVDFGIFAIKTKVSLTLLFTANSEASREKRLGYFAIHEIIRENAGSGLILDFAGSSIPSVASFMSSFGSTDHPYFRIFSNRLPWPVRLLK